MAILTKRGHLKTERESVCISHVYQDAMRKNITTYQALDMLTLERRANRESLNDNVILEKQAYEIFIAFNSFR